MLVPIALAAAFGVLAGLVTSTTAITRLDQRVLDFLVRHRSDGLTRLAKVVTNLGAGSVVTIVVVTVVAYELHRGDRRRAIFVAATPMLTAVSVAVAKHVVDRARPPVSVRLVGAFGAAFPSGHAAQSVACYSAVAVALVAGTSSPRRRIAVTFTAVMIAVSVGASRAYLGVHWLSDVIGGWMLAAAWLAALRLLLVPTTTSR